MKGGELTQLELDTYNSHIQECFTFLKDGSPEELVNNKPLADFFIEIFKREILSYIDEQYSTFIMREKITKESMLEQVESFYRETYTNNDDRSINLFGKVNIFSLQCILLITFTPIPENTTGYAYLIYESIINSDWKSYNGMIDALDSNIEYPPYFNLLLNRNVSLTQNVSIEDNRNVYDGIFTDGIFLITALTFLTIEMLNESFVNNLFLCGTSFSDIDIHGWKRNPMLFLEHDLKHVGIYQESCFLSKRDSMTVNASPSDLRNFYYYYNKIVTDADILYSINLIFFCIIHETIGIGNCNRFFILNYDEDAPRQELNTKGIKIFLEKDPSIKMFYIGNNSPLKEEIKDCSNSKYVNFSVLCGKTFKYIMLSIRLYLECLRGYCSQLKDDKQIYQPNLDTDSLSKKNDDILTTICLTVSSILIDESSKDIFEYIDKFTNLTELAIIQTTLTSLPESLGSLRQLYELVIINNNSLTSLPESIGNLKQIEYLNLANNNLTSLPLTIKASEITVSGNPNLDVSNFESINSELYLNLQKQLPNINGNSTRKLRNNMGGKKSKKVKKVKKVKKSKK